MIKYKATRYYQSVFTIDYKKLKNENKKLLCFDLDNTLDYPDKKDDDLTGGIENLITNLKETFEIYIVSNNAHEERVKKFANHFDLEFSHSFGKPFQKKYKEDQVINKYKKEEIVFIGDKIVTDIIGANKFGSLSILVDPLHEKNLLWYTKIMGLAENIFRMLVLFPRGKYYE